MIEKALGLDMPVHVQYVRWMSNIIMHVDCQGESQKKEVQE